MNQQGNNSNVCTLFEGDYHFGLGALTNSLYAHGFRGTIWAGYRGDLPPWAKPATAHSAYAEYQVAQGCVIRFLRLETTAHLTNFKPDFMLSILDQHDPACEALFYIDPDIVINEPWPSFEEWITCGVAVCEDVNSPFPVHHPRRVGWRRCFGKIGITLRPRDASYANGGFVGIARGNREFLVTWKRLQDAMWTVIGGAEFAGIPGGQSVAGRSGFFDCFGKTDQDALNAAIEAAGEIPVSFLGRQAMGFESGKAMLPHALGALKPWRNRLVRNALRGCGCPPTDRHYWRFVESPIRLYPNAVLQWRRVQLQVAAAIGRFYRRS
jgi:hypothetical protein